MSEALAKRGTSALALPAEFLDDADTIKAASLDFSGDDLALPRLSICQDLTPQRKRLVMGQPNEKWIEGLEPGQIFVGTSKNVYDGPVQFVVLDFFKSNRYFDGAGGVKCRADNGSGCSLNRGGACGNNAWDNTKTDKKDQRPKCTEFYNYVVRVLESGEYALLSFKSTGLKIAREQLNGQLKDTVQPGVAMYRKIFTLTSKPAINDAQQEYFQPVVGRPTMQLPTGNGQTMETGAIVTDKALSDELKRQRLALRSRSHVVGVLDDETDDTDDAPRDSRRYEGHEPADDIPF